MLNDEYESGDDLPPVKDAEETLAKTNSKNQKPYLIASIAFLVVAAVFLVVAIDRMNIVFVILAVASAAPALVFILLFEKAKKQNAGGN